jgi:tetratricopeptide (TPR) repeat protein
MNRTLEVCSVGWLLAAALLFAQSDEWLRLMQRGEALERTANYRQAASFYLHAVKIARDREVVASLNALGLAYEQMGRFPEAERYLRRALAEDDLSKPDRALLLTNLSLVYREAGQTNPAEALLDQAIALESETISTDDNHLLLTRAALAELFLMEKRYGQAEPMLEELLAAFEKHPDHWQQEIATLLGDLGVVREFQGKNDEAIDLFRRAIAIHEAALGAEHPILLRPLVNLARAQAEFGKVDDAGAIFRRAVAIAERRLDPEHPAYSDVLLNYAAFLRNTGHKREAKSLEARSRDARRESARRDGTKLIVDASAFRLK